MKVIRDTLKSNITYWFNIRWNRKYRPYLDRYEVLANPLWEHRKVEPREGYRMCSFHSHTDGRSLRDFAMISAKNGFDLVFVMDHDSDGKFEGNLVRHYEFREGKGVYLARGIECRCKDIKKKHFGPFRWAEITKILFAMYDGEIKTKQPLVETVRKAKEQGAIIISASTLHTGATAGISRRNIELLMSDERTRLDGIETLDAGYGFVGKSINRHYWACAVAEYIADSYGIPVIWSPNDHTDAESGVVANFIKNSDLPCLDNPQVVLRNPYLLREQLRDVFARRAIIPAGSLSPIFSFLRPERLRIVALDTKESLGRKAENVLDVVAGKNGK